jgi:hypothetical protein
VALRTAQISFSVKSGLERIDAQETEKAIALVILEKRNRHEYSGQPVLAIFNPTFS